MASSYTYPSYFTGAAGLAAAAAAALLCAQPTRKLSPTPTSLLDEIYDLQKAGARRLGVKPAAYTVLG